MVPTNFSIFKTIMISKFSNLKVIVKVVAMVKMVNFGGHLGFLTLNMLKGQKF